MNLNSNLIIDEAKIKLFQDYLYLKTDFYNWFSKFNFCEVYYDGLDKFINVISESELNGLIKKDGTKLFDDREIKLILEAKQFISEPNHKIGLYRCKVRSTVTLSREVEVEFKVIDRDCVNIKQATHEEFIKQEAFEKYDELFPEEDYSEFEFEEGESDVIEIEYLGS
ncbi:hypothetical protein Sta7437_4921 (plasmid) [Stanieria cyanosphaera PCC 7437]|uniref:Uncharacterized protein n=1 Tax=Stanieria cyanosphaera (strain ATCC 29371 / PCC 7437) TaxID=111780 RepID=K9Y0S9_STAC7|nr:hypothetical protein [Stanieria cyanosphaera]AFZ38348.1 hypothetical protein Sta7437_4921 [Stanieria cyanosphaera PCC 7437]